MRTDRTGPTGRTEPSDLRPETSGWRHELPALLALAATVAVLLWPVVFAGRAPLPDYLLLFAPWRELGVSHAPWNPLWYDAVGQYWPWRTLLHDGLHTGVLPYWQPYQFCGYAFCGTGQSALFYPVNWLLFSLPVMLGFRLTAVFHLWLAGVGTYAVVRQLGGRRSAALTAGFVFQLSAFMVGWLMLPTLISSAAWLPVAVAGLERCRATRHAGWSAAAGGAVAMAALAGHPQVFFYVGITAGALCVVRLRRTPRLWLPFGLVALAGSLPMAMPLLELAPRSHRPPTQSAEGLPAFLGRSIPAGRALTLFRPDTFGSPDRGTIDPSEPQTIRPTVFDGGYWGFDRQGAISPGDYTEFGVFIGLVPLWLALLALLWGNRDARGYALLGFGALWLAFGQFPVGPLYRFLPGFSAGAGTCRLAAVWCFGAAVAAGLTAERLQSSPLGWRQLLGGLALLLAGWVVAAQLTQASVRELGLLPVAEAASFGAKLAGLQGWAFLAAGLAVALRATRWLPVLVAAELLWFGWGYNPSSDPAIFRTPATLQELAARPPRVLVADRPQGWGFYRRPEGFALPPNLATVAGIRDVGGYDSLLPALHKDVFFQAAGRSPTPLINGNMLLLGGVRWRDAPPPVSQAMSASGTVEHKSVGRARRLTAAGRFADPGEVSDPSANRTLVTIDGDGALLLYDSPYPGWQVYLGQPGLTPARGIWSASPFAGRDRIARFVPLPAPARWQVRFVFNPTTVRLGIFGGLLGLGCGIATVLGGSPGRGIMPTEPSE